MPSSPFRPSNTDSANRAAAYACKEQSVSQRQSIASSPHSEKSDMWQLHVVLQCPVPHRPHQPGEVEDKQELQRVKTKQEYYCSAVTSHRDPAHHGERGRSRACLSLHNLRARVLDAVSQLGRLILAELHLGGGLQRKTTLKSDAFKPTSLDYTQREEWNVRNMTRRPHRRSGMAQPGLGQAAPARAAAGW